MLELQCDIFGDMGLSVADDFKVIGSNANPFFFGWREGEARLARE
jgi:hypothetical protein